MPASARRSVYLIETYWLPLTLSCLSSTRWGGEYAVDLAGHVTLQAAHDLAFGQPLQGPASDIGSGPLVGSHSAHDDHVQGGVGLPAPNSNLSAGPLIGGRARRIQNFFSSYARLYIQSCGP